MPAVRLSDFSEIDTHHASTPDLRHGSSGHGEHEHGRGPKGRDEKIEVLAREDEALRVDLRDAEDADEGGEPTDGCVTCHCPAAGWRALRRVSLELAQVPSEKAAMLRLGLCGAWRDR